MSARSRRSWSPLPEADNTGNFKLLTGATCYRINSDNSGKVTGVAYYVLTAPTTRSKPRLIVTTFIYDNTRLLLLSKTDKFPNGLANSSGQLGKHVMAHMMANVFVGFDDRHLNVYMGPSAQKHTPRRLQRRQLRSQGCGLHPRLADLDRDRQPAGRPDRPHHGGDAARRAALGCGVSRLPGEVFRPPRGHGGADREPALCRPDHRPRSQRARRLGVPAPRVTYDWRRPNERARVEFMQKKMEEIGR
jgi:gluconate 2-dehydrogenase alpha chain